MIEKITSDKLKNEVLKYWRIKRNGYDLCGTEVNLDTGIADVLIYSENDIIEIEIKISYSDFLKDFKKRKYKIMNDKYYFLNANRLFYCVPNNIKDKCLNYLKENNMKVGLFSFNGKLTMIKKCKKIKDLTETEKYRIKYYLIKRITSELLRLRLEYLE